MTIYAVTYEHPDEAGWQLHLMAHLVWLQDRVKDGSLLASGPLNGRSVKSALLVMRAPDQPSLETIIGADPFAIEGLIANMTIEPWDPIFGSFNADSSMPQAK
jgi:uncharacterized protein YciI